MAKPIREFRQFDSPPEVQQAQDLTDLLKAVANHHHAILETLEVLGHLHRLGILAAAKSLLDKSHEVSAIAIKQFNQPKMRNTIKNAMTAVEAIGSIQPDHLQRLLNGLAHGLETSKAVTHDGDPPSLWELAKLMRDPDVRASMATMLGLVKGMGQGLQNDSQQVH